MRKLALCLGLLALSVSRVPLASADTYQIGGPAGAAVWASYDGQMATQAVVLTLSDAGKPNDGSSARCTFNILQWGFTSSGLMFRQFYGDAALWRPIAIANQIADPRRLPVALQVSIPKLPYRDPDTGILYSLGNV